jgi:hypothetical protein
MYVTEQEIVFNSTAYSLQTTTHQYFQVPKNLFFAKPEDEKKLSATAKADKL